MTKKAITKIINLGTNVLTIIIASLTMAFNVVTVKVSVSGMTEEISVSGYDSVLASLTGSNYDSGLLGLGVAVVMAMCVICAITAIVTSDDKVAAKTDKSVALLVSLSLLYMIVGATMVSALKEQDLAENVRITTATVWPFMLSLTLGVSYVLTKIFYINKEECYYIASEKKANAAQNEDITKTLLKYKELLDNGVISEEEFSAIKSELLK